MGTRHVAVFFFSFSFSFSSSSFSLSSSLSLYYALLSLSTSSHSFNGTSCSAHRPSTRTNQGDLEATKTSSPSSLVAQTLAFGQSTVCAHCRAFIVLNHHIPVVFTSHSQCQTVQRELLLKMVPLVLYVSVRIVGTLFMQLELCTKIQAKQSLILR